MIQLHNQDAAEVLAAMPDGSADSIITDPPWPGGEQTNLIGHDDADAAFARVAVHFKRLSKRTIIILGDDTDPNILRHVQMRFLCVRPLINAGFQPRGRRFVLGRIAYCFGEYAPAKPNRTTVPAHAICTTNKGAYQQLPSKTTHPCPLRLDHCAWLVHWFSENHVLDPFMGAGTIGAACRMQGKSFTGCEIDPVFFAEASANIEQSRPLFECASNPHELTT